MSIFFVCGDARCKHAVICVVSRDFGVVQFTILKLKLHSRFLHKNGIFSSLTKNKTKQIEEEEEEKLVLSRYVRHDWSDDDDERNAAEKPDDREERFFVGLIVKNDDICFTHILPRLNSTDSNSCTSE